MLVQTTELPGFPDAAWRGPFADYRAAMRGTTEAPQCSHFAALWTHAALRLRRRIWLDYAVRLFANVYLVIFGPTADAKKTTSMRLSERLLPDERVKVLRGVGSGEALADWMRQKNPARPVAHLLLLEELSTLLRRAGWDGSLLIPYLTEAFDCPPKYEVPFRKNAIKVLKPTPNLFAGTTAEWFWKSMREEDIFGGFGNRLCYFAGEPGALISMPAPPAEAALQRVEEGLDGLASISTGTIMHLTPKARRCWDTFYRDLKTRRLDPLVAAMTKRTDVYALKLAMVYAAFEKTTPKITSEQIAAAAAVARYGIACAEWIVGQQRPFSERGRCEEAVLRTLDHSDLPAWKIHHRIGGRFSAEDQMRAIRALMDAGSLIEVKKTSRNTPILGRRGRRRDA